VNYSPEKEERIRLRRFHQGVHPSLLCLLSNQSYGRVFDSVMAGESLAGNDSSPASCTISSRCCGFFFGKQIVTNSDESSTAFKE
jgi:hypothetical protein